jgi:ornithine carbamoyltransferase
LETVLKKIGVVPSFTQDDILNAENEESLREHAIVVHAVTDAIRRRVANNEVLRRAIEQAKERTADIGEFERKIRGEFN